MHCTIAITDEIDALALMRVQFMIACTNEETRLSAHPPGAQFPRPTTKGNHQRPLIKSRDSYKISLFYYRSNVR